MDTIKPTTPEAERTACSPLSAALSVVREYNSWRSGELETEMPHPPKVIGQAIELVCSCAASDTPIVDWLAAHWDSQGAAQRLLQGHFIANPTGSLRDACRAALANDPAMPTASDGRPQA